MVRVARVWGLVLVLPMLRCVIYLYHQQIYRLIMYKVIQFVNAPTLALYQCFHAILSFLFFSFTIQLK
ncbi:hypothetical protein J3F84DRAFT_218838 [Trichoderma pleuroticola]